MKLLSRMFYAAIATLFAMVFYNPTGAEIYIIYLIVVVADWEKIV